MALLVSSLLLLGGSCLCFFRLSYKPLGLGLGSKASLLLGLQWCSYNQLAS